MFFFFVFENDTFNVDPVNWSQSPTKVVSRSLLRSLHMLPKLREKRILRPTNKTTLTTSNGTRIDSDFSIEKHEIHSHIDLIAVCLHITITNIAFYLSTFCLDGNESARKAE